MMNITAKMPVLDIPSGGIQLASSFDGTIAANELADQAFGVSLSDKMIEDMIKCFQSGRNIELSLENNKPRLLYGNEEHQIELRDDCSGFDLYRTNPATAPAKAQRLPNPTMPILSATGWRRPGRVDTVRTAIKGAESSSRKPEARCAGKAPGSFRPSSGKPVKSAAQSSSAANLKYTPNSPSISAAASPVITMAEAVQQRQMDESKAVRVSLVHELAVKERSKEYLATKFSGSEAELTSQLKRIAVPNSNNTWSLSKMFWNELDVWNYGYASQEERQSAIDNAIKMYDKKRIGPSEPEWERLQPVENRGKGIVLSKLHATLMKGRLALSSKMSTADDESLDEGEKAADMSRTSSSASTHKTARPKPTDLEVQTKRFLSKNPKRPTAATKKAPSAKEKEMVAREKAAAGKGKAMNSKAKTTAEKGKKVLSEAYVVDSSSGEDVPLAEAKAKSNPNPAQQRVANKVTGPSVEKKAVEKNAPTKPAKKAEDEKAKEMPAPAKKAEDEKAKEMPAPASTQKAKAKLVARPLKPVPARMRKASTAAPPATTQKRARDEEENSSSSGTPLSKRVKTMTTAREQVKAAPSSSATNNVKHRQSDACMNTRGTVSSASSKTKNNSPAKSSPLASSPPTNASDVSGDTSQSDDHGPRNGLSNGHRLPNGTATKRKERDWDSGDNPARKKVDAGLLKMAQDFKEEYDRYVSLHERLSRMESPSRDEVRNLTQLRDRLASVKSQISRRAAAL